jgi:hypothetical protein
MRFTCPTWREWCEDRKRQKKDRAREQHAEWYRRTQGWRIRFAFLPRRLSEDSREWVWLERIAIKRHEIFGNTVVLTYAEYLDQRVTDG